MNLREPILAAPLMDSKTPHTDENILAAMKRLKYPVAVTLKMDGIRALTINGSLFSRRLKRIPNKEIREASSILGPACDVELWNRDLQYHEIESIVMSREHKNSEKICFNILDRFDLTHGYISRVQHIASYMHNIASPRVKFAPPTICENAEQLFTFFRMVEEEGGEGICFRTLNSPYKQGRSTLREQHLVKLARWQYAEAVIVGFEEQMENGNSTKRNGTGKIDRSSCQSGLVGKDTLGSLVVRICKATATGFAGADFCIGTGEGLTDKLRKEIWLNRHNYIGRTIKYKCKGHGTKIKPRSPVFVGFRNMEID